MNSTRILSHFSKSLNRQKNVSFSTALYTWGDGKHGALGHKNVDNITRPPRRLVKSKQYKEVSCGEQFSLALDHDGHLFGWGTGPGTGFESNVPFPIPTPDGMKMKKISCGSKHAACIGVDGHLYTWGKQKTGWFSSGGQLGHGDKEVDVPTPKLLQSLKNYGVLIGDVSCGAEHTLILTDDGEVLSCGVGEYGRLGNGNSKSATTPASLDTLINTSTVITSVAAGSNHSMALSSGGSVYTWGRNDAGQLGFADTYIDIYSMEEFPRKIEADAFNNEKIVQISATSGRSAAVSENGNVYVWGRKLNHFPTLLDYSGYFSDKVKVRKVVLGRNDSEKYCGFLLTDPIDLGENGENPSNIEGYTLWSYGDFRTNMLGKEEKSVDNKSNQHPIPEPVVATTFSSKTRVLDVSSGVGHVAAVVKVD